MSKTCWTDALAPVIPERFRRQKDDSLTRFGKTVGMVALALIALGVIANIPDIKRYVRMSMM
jgi:hypothetical protein